MFILPLYNYLQAKCLFAKISTKTEDATTQTVKPVLLSLSILNGVLCEKCTDLGKKTGFKNTSNGKNFDFFSPPFFWTPFTQNPQKDM